MISKSVPIEHSLVVATLGALIGGLIILLITGAPSKTVPVDIGSSPAPASKAGPVSYARAVARAAPSVVRILTTKITTEHQSLAFKDPLLQHYFGHRLPRLPHQYLDTQLGSGVIVSKEGYLLTNQHILAGAEEIRVLLPNGRNTQVHVIGKDPETDLAVLKMDANQAPAIPVGNIEDLQVGDVVLAIGNPFGMGQTVTLGIVSATGRSHLGISARENFIQTDAAINPGNSGGALINAQGELIGINTALYSKSGGSQGIGFAIPVDLAVRVLDQIVHQGQVTRGWIGVSGQNMNPDNRKAFGLYTDSGVLVSGVLADGPAAKGGLRDGDVITQIDNRSLHNVHDFLEVVANVGPDREMRIAGWRGSQQFEVRVRTIERPAVPD